MKKHNINSIALYTSISAVIFTVLCTTGISYAEDAKLTKQDFKYFSEIKTNQLKNKLNQVHINESIINKTENYLADIRIYDNKGTEVPYIILDNTIPPENEENYHLKIMEYSSTNSTDQIIASMQENKAVNMLSFNTDAVDFRKNIKLYGSNNSRNWNFIISKDIYDFSSKIPLRNTEIKFPKTSYKYYRMNLSKSNENIDSQSLHLKYGELNLNINDTNNKEFRINSLIATNLNVKKVNEVYDSKVFKKFDIKTESKKSYIKLEANLPFNKISFKVNNPYYYRALTVYFADIDKPENYRLIFQNSLFKIPLEKTEERNEFESLSGKHRFYKIEIDDRDSPPLKIEEIKLEWLKKNMFFMEQNNQSDYGIYFGNKSVESPTYDFSSFVNQSNWFKQSFQEIKPGEIKANKEFKVTTSADEKENLQKNILIAIVCVITLILVFWLYSMIKGVQSKEY